MMKLADQAKMGRVVIVALVMVLLLPLVIGFVALPQAPTIEGTYIRENNRAFRRFLDAIKSHDGVLVLGTSETGNHLSGENYWALLNRDQDVKPYFSVLGGAGRCSYIWFPPILANPRSFRGLHVLYYLNPTYWRDDLNGFSHHYYDRYNGALMVRQILPQAERSGLLPLVKPYFQGRYEKEDWRDFLVNQVKNFNSFYSYDLYHLFKGSFPRKSHQYRHPAQAEIWMWQNGLDLTANVSQDYLEQNPGAGIPPIGASDFQYQALMAFVKLCKKVGIDVVVFVGPYNGILARRFSPEVIPQYETVLANVKQILVQSRTRFIDGTDLSFDRGVFRDAQHNSTFGAWKIEQKIAAYYRR